MFEIWAKDRNGTDCFIATGLSEAQADTIVANVLSLLHGFQIWGEEI